MDTDLVCNYKKCRKHLSTFAWVTSCSHIFCDEHGTKQFKQNSVCPACETALSGKYGIIRVDLQPSEQYISMVLVGQKPETIMEICTRALSFWHYQSHQEKKYQAYIANKSTEKVKQMEQYYEQIITRTQAEINNLKAQLTGNKKDLEDLNNRYKKEIEEAHKKCNELSEKNIQKSRQFQKLQTMFDALRRKCINPSTFDAAGDSFQNSHARNNFSLPLDTSGEVLNRRRHSPPEREFVLRPITPQMGGNRQRDQDVHERFNLEIHTPRG